MRYFEGYSLAISISVRTTSRRFTFSRWTSVKNLSSVGRTAELQLFTLKILVSVLGHMC